MLTTRNNGYYDYDALPDGYSIRWPDSKTPRQKLSSSVIYTPNANSDTNITYTRCEATPP